jgi:hypothetical protein
MDGTSWIGEAALLNNVATLALKLPAGIHPLTAILRLPELVSDTPVVYQVVDTPLSCN